MPELIADRHFRKARRLLKSGEINQARALYREILNTYPDNTRALKALAEIGASGSRDRTGASVKTKLEALAVLYRQRRYAQVIQSAQAILVDHPGTKLAYHLLGAAHLASGDPGQAETAFRHAVDLAPENADAHNNLGAALRDQGRHEEAVTAYRRAVARRPAYAEAHSNMSASLTAQGLFLQAVAASRRAIELRPEFAEAHNTLGAALLGQGASDDARAAFERALELKPGHPEALTNLGGVLVRSGDLETAIVMFRRALAVAPRDTAALNGLGVALQFQGDRSRAIKVFRRALDIKPEFAEAFANMAGALRDQGDLHAAISAYRRALELQPANASVEARLVMLLHMVCDWEALAAHTLTIPRLGVDAGPVAPFNLLAAEDAPERQLARSRGWAARHPCSPPVWRPKPPAVRPARLRVGLFGADFRDHAAMYLMMGVLREYDRSRFEVCIFSYGRDKSGDMRDRAEGYVDDFFDVAEAPDEDLIAFARSHRLDIAIDMMGYTRHTRSHVFSARLASLQIAYLGYPGTTGSNCLDYLIADAVVVPEQERASYCERIIYMPGSYLPSDDQREIADMQSSRSDFALPEDAFVFCCFNQSYKITAPAFEIWMRVMSRIPDSVLWLIEMNTWAKDNLRREALEMGVDPARIIFAERVPTTAEHLARHKHADLFLDTFNYNAHTTASDALWAGLPVLTMPGRQFAARVGASLVRAVGLPELVAPDLAAYEATILELATNPQRLAAIRERLLANRRTHPLFDTKGYTRAFEKGLDEAYERYLTGKSPGDIRLADDVCSRRENAP